MERFSTIASLRAFTNAAKARGRTIALVPTMGALHAGHRECVELGRGAADLLLVSIFVNPTQFGAGEDLSNYPGSLDQDLENCRAWGCDAVFTPEVREMYPADPIVWVDVEGLSATLCGKTRQGHFRGVATVVAKLFLIAEPDIAVFGQKDAQQAVVIKRMVEQLNFPVALRLCPTVRDGDGLALSSRNRYLSDRDRTRATGIHAGLQAGRAALASGERDPRVIRREVSRVLGERSVTDVEYVELVDVKYLMPVDTAQGKVLLAVAARVGAARLIDNLVLEVGARVDDAMLF
jgi:pantoate--beta-alanine ligase